MSERDLRGVMDEGYAEGRIRKRHLRYRYQVRAQIAVDGFRKFFPYHRDVEVLELGAAEGLTLLEIRKLLGSHGRYVGVELSDGLRAAAPRLPANVRLCKGDVTRLPEELESGSYDLCTALAVLEHVPSPLACVQEAFRMLRPGGVFVATCPHPFWDQLAGRFGLVQDEHHETEVSSKMLADLAEQAGFARVEARPFMWVLTGVLPYLGWSLEPALSLRLDALVARVGVLDFSFVNQVLVAQKPFSAR